MVLSRLGKKNILCMRPWVPLKEGNADMKRSWEIGTALFNQFSRNKENPKRGERRRNHGLRLTIVILDGAGDSNIAGGGGRKKNTWTARRDRETLRSEVEIERNLKITSGDRVLSRSAPWDKDSYVRITRPTCPETILVVYRPPERRTVRAATLLGSLSSHCNRATQK